ncbi:hypothetical protein HHK36_006329 [Tetracentron sinense]|uniref:Uncharacterized protein n=1 Tax=Tetracentron sinense TaxID=13715 RepID=A0A834ZIQ0_TETSI|nr:hypothetical protein HHK36_006329 [Tetracentron sinense]
MAETTRTLHLLLRLQLLILVTLKRASGNLHLVEEFFPLLQENPHHSPLLNPRRSHLSKKSTKIYLNFVVDRLLLFPMRHLQELYQRNVIGKGKEVNTGIETESQALKMEFVKIYSYDEFGQKHQPADAKGFSLDELNERLMKLREIEEKETKLRIGGVSFKDLRESLVRLRMSDDDKSRKSLSGGGMCGRLGCDGLGTSASRELEKESEACCYDVEVFEKREGYLMLAYCMHSWLRKVRIKEGNHIL